MITITVPQVSIEYAVIQLDKEIARLVDEQSNALQLHNIAIITYSPPIAAYWAGQIVLLQERLDEARRAFIDLRSILVGLADSDTCTIIVTKAEAE